jgi:uncharacterized membrane protein YhdT
MWVSFLIALGAATVLLSGELRRLRSRYGTVLSIAPGALAVLATAAWMLVVMLLALDQNRYGFSTFKIWWLFSTLLMPLIAFAVAKRRFSTTGSIFSATAVFAAVTFVFVNVGLGLAYAD